MRLQKALYLGKSAKIDARMPRSCEIENTAAYHTTPYNKILHLFYLFIAFKSSGFVKKVQFVHLDNSADFTEKHLVILAIITDLTESYKKRIV